MSLEIKIMNQRYLGKYVEGRIGSVYHIVDIYTYEGFYCFQVIDVVGIKANINWYGVCKELETYFNIIDFRITPHSRHSTIHWVIAI
jgi:hypothetical protein